VEIGRCQRPGAGRVFTGSVETEGNHQAFRPEFTDPLEGPLERPVIAGAVEELRQGVVAVAAMPGTLPALFGEARKIGIGEAGMTVNGDGQHVASFIKDILSAVAVVVINVENRHLPMAAQVLGGDGRGVEVAETAEDPSLGMVAGWADQGIADPVAAEKPLGGGQRAVDGAFCRFVGVSIERGKGVDAIIAGPYRHLLGRPGGVADGKDIRIDRFPRFHGQTHPLQVLDKGRFMHFFDVFLREMVCGNGVEQTGGQDPFEDGGNPHRCFHVAAFVDVVNIMAFVNHQGNSLINVDRSFTRLPR
jgi:hypothetical protein